MRTTKFSLQIRLINISKIKKINIGIDIERLTSLVKCTHGRPICDFIIAWLINSATKQFTLLTIFLNNNYVKLVSLNWDPENNTHQLQTNAEYRQITKRARNIVFSDFTAARLIANQFASRAILLDKSAVTAGSFFPSSRSAEF